VKLLGEADPLFLASQKIPSLTLCDELDAAKAFGKAVPPPFQCASAGVE
jgi:hypothetical protein